MIIWWNPIKGSTGVVNVPPAPQDVRDKTPYSVDGVDYVGMMVANTFLAGTLKVGSKTAILKVKS